MSSEDRREHERRLDDERCVDALLAEAGFPDDIELRGVLLQLRSHRVAEVPQPSAEIAALMGQQAAADVVRLEDWSRRHPRKKRVVFTTFAVAASLGIAGGAAAGNDTLRRQAEGTISSIVKSFSPRPPETPAPAPPSNIPTAPPADVPSPAGTLPAATVPADAAPVEVPTTEPSVGGRPEDSESPGRSAQLPHDPADPSAVPDTGGQPAQPGASREGPVPSRAGQPPASTPGPLNSGKERDKAGPNGNRP
jgi:hypothetical protein